MARSVLIVGAGIVGVCCGVELAEAGWQVRIVDHDMPGRRASRWNAGVLATSSLVPFNRPGLVGQLPGLLLGRSPGFRLAPRALGTTARWGPRFIAAARTRVFAETVRALDGLISLSLDTHRFRIEQAGKGDLWSPAGWLMLYETSGAFAATSGLRAIFAQHGVAHDVLGPEDIARLEPHLARRFARAIWLTESAFVGEPGRVLQAYFDRFRQLGGTAQQASVARLEMTDRPAAILDDGSRQTADHVILAAGPWSKGLLATLGLRLPMMSERGYVRRFPLGRGACLHRPIYDVEGGLVLAPRPEGVQLSTGTELTLPDLPGLDRQREAAAHRASSILPLEPALAGFDATADRPTMPDSRPVIGKLSGGPIWLCCGHQHIGFATAPGSAQVLASLMKGVPPPIKAAPFAPGRFGL